MIDKPEGYAAIQRDLDRLEKWSQKNLTKFSKGKFKVLPLRRTNSRHTLGAYHLESNSAEKGSGIDTKLIISYVPFQQTTASWEECLQQVKGGDSSPLISPGKASPGLLGPVLEFSVLERQGATGANPVKGNGDG